MPLTWILFLLLLAVFTKREKRRRLLLIASTILLLFFTNPFLVNEAWLLWEQPPTPLKNLKSYDAAIILTGITNQAKTPHDRIYTARGADRALHPLQLYKQGKIKKIIISGGSGSLRQKYSSEALEIKQLLVYSGVQHTDILYEDRSRNTHENAQYTKEVLKQHPELKTLLLVTSAFHIRRAQGCFKKQGIQTDAFSTDFFTMDRSYSIDRLLVPQEVCLYYWQKLIHEMLGFIVYRIMGYC